MKNTIKDAVNWVYSSFFSKYNRII
jgi:hypothetical protein